MGVLGTFAQCCVTLLSKDLEQIIYLVSGQTDLNMCYQFLSFFLFAVVTFERAK